MGADSEQSFKNFYMWPLLSGAAEKRILGKSRIILTFNYISVKEGRGGVILGGRGTYFSRIFGGNFISWGVDFCHCFLIIHIKSLAQSEIFQGGGAQAKPEDQRIRAEASRRNISWFSILVQYVCFFKLRIYKNS